MESKRAKGVGGILYDYRFYDNYFEQCFLFGGGAFVLPDTIFALVNEEINIYYANVLGEEYLKEDYKYLIEYTGNGISEQLEDRYRIIPEDCGTYTLKFQIFKDGKYQDKKEVLIEVSEVIGSGQENNILVIGDSTVANGIMLNKWNTLAKEAKIMINFIGTKGNDIKHEGISGWTANKFAFDEESPFVFNGTINFKKYIEENDLSSPEYVCINLGINDMFLAKDNKELRKRMKEALKAYEQLIDSIKQYDSKIIIGIVVPIPPAQSQDAFGKAHIGQTQWRYKINIESFQKMVIEKYSGVYDVIPVYVNLDTANAMGNEWCQISARDFRTREEIPANGHVHPDDIGYAQMADEMWAWYNWRLQNSENRY